VGILSGNTPCMLLTSSQDRSAAETQDCVPSALGLLRSSSKAADTLPSTSDMAFTEMPMQTGHDNYRQ
jgi:hypothetical protein